MKNFGFYLIVIAFGVIFMPLEVFACSCVKPIPGESLETKVERAQHHAKAIFTATVLKLIEKKTKEGNIVLVKLKLLQTFKGDFSNSKEVTIQTGNGVADCGYIFKVGENYLIYANEIGAMSSYKKVSLQTNICTRTQRTTNIEQELALLEKNGPINK